MITLFIVVVFLMFLGGILFIPLRIVVNTQQKQYFISLPGYFRADLLFTNQLAYQFKLKVFFFSFHIEPGKKRKAAAKTTETFDRNNQTKANWSRMKKPLVFFRKAIACFRINRFYAEIDTGNYPLNAQLIPFAQRISNGNIDLSINFENRNVIDLYLTTKIHRIAYAVIKHKINNK